MSQIMLLLAAGMGLGWLAAGCSDIRRFGRFNLRLQQCATGVLLFFMGIWLSDNRQFWDNIAAIGTQGLVIALGATAGSVVAVWLLAKLCLKKDAAAKPPQHSTRPPA